MTMTTRRVAVFALALSSIAAGCGSGSDSAGSPAASGSDGTVQPTESDSATTNSETTNTATEPDPSVADTGAPATTAAPQASSLPDEGPNIGFTDIDGWINGDVTSLDELKGQVVAVQFWTFGCSNCKATLPHVQELNAKYGDSDFTIVGVHSPEFDHEADVDNIEAAIENLGVTWPVVLDTRRTNFRAWQGGGRAFWPRIYLLDKQGHVRYDHIGEGAYDEIDANVAALLAEPAA